MVPNKGLTKPTVSGEGLTYGKMPITKGCGVNIAQPEEYEELPPSVKIKRKFIWFLKKLLLFAISHVGLTCIVVCYSILGAIIFESLESWNEQKSRIAVSGMRERVKWEIWNISTVLNIFRKANWTKKANEYLIRFQREIYLTTKESGWDGVSDVAERELYWSFTGALLYSVTVITTIGYGHITPKTTEGRVATIFYAMIGIPLTLLCLANIGTAMGTAFRALYWKTAEKVCQFRRKKLTYTGPYTKSAYDSNTKNFIYDKTISTTAAATLSTGTGSPFIVEQAQEAERNKYKKEVPMVVCLIIVVVYNLLGSLLFTVWETDWSFLTGIYFCFITLSTIGFGDVVPGSDIEAWQSHEKRVLCTLYLLFGLALIAMCFDLMQRQVRDMCSKFAMRIGLVDDTTPQEAEHVFIEVEKINTDV